MNGSVSQGEVFSVRLESVILTRSDMAGPGPRESALILAVDDEVLNLELLERSLRRRYSVLTASTPARALEMLAAEPDVAVILSDYRMPGMTGTELLGETVTSHPDTKRVIITGYADNDAVARAADAGEVDYVIKKPWRHKQLHQLVQQFVQGYRLARENRSLSRDLREVHQELEVRDELFAATVDGDKRDLAHTAHELRRANKELQEQSYRDSATGLYSRRAFLDRLGEEIARAQRYDHPVSLLYGDIDQLDQLNQAAGREVGDRALREVARLIAEDEATRVRDSDIVGRLSGDEFGILLVETDRSGGAIKANRLREAVARLPLPDDLVASISFGIACAPDDATDADKLLANARAALDSAKRTGRNRQALYTRPADADGSLYGAVKTGGGGALAPSIPTIGTGAFRLAESCVPEVGKMLEHTRALSALHIDMSRLERLRPSLGRGWHTDVHQRVAQHLEAMLGQTLDRRDVLCRTAGQDFACFLAPLPPTDDGPRSAKALAEKVEALLDEAIEPIVPRHLRALGRLAVGTDTALARTGGAPRMRAVTVIEELLAGARRQARRQLQDTARQRREQLIAILAEDRLTPVYQPLVSLPAAKVVGYRAAVHGPRNSDLESWEALALSASGPWTTDGSGAQHGSQALRQELERAQLRRVLEGAQELDPAHQLFVTVGARMLYDTALIQTRVDEFLLSGALTANNLVLCLSQEDAMAHFVELRRALAVYGSQGFGVAIHDVGRGSDLESLLQLEPDFIELTAETTRDLASERAKREVVRILVQLASSAQTALLCRDIANADDLAALYALGVTCGRGRLLGRPGAPFPRLRTSVKRAIEALAHAPARPTPAPPAEEAGRPSASDAADE